MTRMSSGTSYSVRGLAVCLSFVLAACSAPSMKDGKADAPSDGTRSNAAERASRHFARLGEILFDIERRETHLHLHGITDPVEDATLAAETDKQFYQGIVSNAVHKFPDYKWSVEPAGGFIYVQPLSAKANLQTSGRWFVDSIAASYSDALGNLKAGYEVSTAKIMSKGFPSWARYVELIAEVNESVTAVFAENYPGYWDAANLSDIDQRKIIGLITPSAISGAPPLFS